MKKISLVFLSFLLLLSGCEESSSIVSGVDEREANQILVFLASRHVPAQKVAIKATGAGTGNVMTYNILVSGKKQTEAMALLNQVGLPRRKNSDLLTLFAKQGLMSSEKEETIRYQAGLGAQIAGTIMKIDGVLDADVQLAFPEGDAEEKASKRTTASVYVKHQGSLDDPNLHLVTKIKRIVSSSVPALKVEDVTVISDRSRFTDISLNEAEEMVLNKPKEYVSIWSMVMNKDSVGTFRMLFLSLISLIIFFLLLIAALVWKFYPVIMQRGGFLKLFNLNPLKAEEAENTDEEV